MWPRVLSSSYPMEAHYFMVPKFALSLIGFYPEQKRSWALLAWSFFNFSILTYGCYAEGAYGIQQIPINIGLALDALCPVASSILSLIKMLSVWYYRDEFKSLIDRIRQLTEEQHSDRKLGYKKSYYTLATRLTALLLLCGTCTSTSYTVRHIFENMLRLSHGKVWIYETPFKMNFPDVFLRLPLYPWIYALVCWHGYITVACFVGADGFFLGFCLYLTVLLRSLRDDIKDLLQLECKGIEVEPTVQEEKRIVREMVKLINRHNEIADLTERLSGVMVEITLAHFVTSSLIIGTSILDMLMFSGVGIIVYLVYTLAVTTEIFLYCLGGTYIMEACLDLARSTFASHWYGHSVPVQKMTLLMIARAQRVLVVKIPFFSPSMETLTSILRFTGSIIALAKSVI
ncbi:odorant receptor 24a [Drosophila grimshawi]|uniref:Odorant receptor n=1 Tax=Drosophila grimshawi TaxID=7222 RepID=B4JB71_DROGR|nr:odorant receptor 24a [Drosophila grimshawi]EDW03963.1 GH10234 [Drosophila grimshawi]